MEILTGRAGRIVKGNAIAKCDPKLALSQGLPR